MEVPLFRINVKRLVTPALRQVLKNNSGTFKAIRTVLDFIKDDPDRTLGARDYFQQRTEDTPSVDLERLPGLSRPSLSLAEIFEVRVFQDDNIGKAVGVIESMLKEHPELRSDFLNLLVMVTEIEQSKNERNKTGTAERIRRHSVGILSRGKDLTTDIRPGRKRDDETVSFETENPNAGKGLEVLVGEPPKPVISTKTTESSEDPELEVCASEIPPSEEVSLEDAIGLYLSEDE